MTNAEVLETFQQILAAWREELQTMTVYTPQEAT